MFPIDIAHFAYGVKAKCLAVPVLGFHLLSM